uniref:hypothetical protein n=1 Tax=Nonomuraea sp. CA-251285 TaxID=3240002 RepID=UPI003F49A48C
MPMLMSRTGGLCEARTPWCLAGPWGGLLASLAAGRVNVHHRQPSKMGGTRRWHGWLDGQGWVECLPSLAEVVLVCGFGNTSGCHGWIESNRELAVMLGWLVPATQPGGEDNVVTDPARVVLVLPNRRRVLLTAEGGYADPLEGPRWA